MGAIVGILFDYFNKKESVEPDIMGEDEQEFYELYHQCEYLFFRFIPDFASLESVFYSDFNLDPVFVFDEVQLEGRVFRFVVYVVWLNNQVESFEKYLPVKAACQALWKKSVERVHEMYVKC